MGCSISSKDAIRVLTKKGWHEARQVGSHIQFKHDAIVGRVTVPHPNKDLNKNTFNSILKQMKISESDFLHCLKNC